MAAACLLTASLPARLPRPPRRGVSRPPGPAVQGPAHLTRPDARPQARPAPRGPAHRTRPAASAQAHPRDLFLLDLDGVLVDSVGELAGSAYAAAVSRWPIVMQNSPYTKGEVLAGLAGGRPRVIAGYEALAMARLMAERGAADGVAAVLADWPGRTLAAALDAWGETPASLIPFFEAHRTAAARDEAAWLAANRAYPGITAALAEVCGPWYVVSSKSPARVALLLRGLLGQEAGFEVGSPRLVAGLQPPDTAKPAAIAALAARAWGVEEGDLGSVGGSGPGASLPPTTLHFVDDRYETLAAVAASPLLGPAVAARALRLHFAGWGYAAAEEKKAALDDSSVTCLTLEAFTELLRWGLVMGVDDGCEPSREEVARGVA